MKARRSMTAAAGEALSRPDARQARERLTASVARIAIYLGMVRDTILHPVSGIVCGERKG